MAAYMHDDGPRITGNYAFYLLPSMGAVDAAYELTEKRMEFKAFIDTKLWWHSSVSEFRRDSRFIALVEGLKLPAFWRQYGWADACRRAGDSFVCE